MTKITIKVPIPINSPMEMEILCDAINTKNTEMGVLSPVKNFITQEFNDLLSLEKLKRTQARQFHAAAQGYTEEADNALGIGLQQNVYTIGTIYNLLTKFRDILLIKYINNEEKISDFGFNVTMERKRGKVTVKVDIPIRKPDTISKLCNDLIAKHTDMGQDSPLAQDDIDALSTQLGIENSKRTLARRTHNQAQSATNDADVALGSAKGQSNKTVNTLYYTVNLVKKTLLIHYRGYEEHLSEWGFNVVIGQAHMPGYRYQENFNINLNAAVTYYLPVTNLNGKTNIQINNKGQAPIEAVLVPSQQDDPSGIWPVIIGGQIAEFLLSNQELGHFTTANFLRLRNQSQDDNTTVAVTIFK
ncbi:MAG: hypothetical protein KA792_08590 [Bacteroidales bacterium]|nr:hypothetical protein [Bacteroidales bacterium]